MDLGIEGRTAVVAASSRGLGRACAAELALAGCRVVVNGRDPSVTGRTAEELAAASGAEVVPVVADLGTAEGRERLFGAAGDVDILVTNNGGPPMADYRSIDDRAVLDGLEANMVVPIRLVRAVLDGMVERRFGRIVNITSASVKMPLAGLDVSSGARAGLTGFLAGVARSVAGANVTVNFLLPGSFDTDRLRSNHRHAAESRDLPLDQVVERARRAIPAGRFGDPDEFGAACAWLCSARAGFVTGQSILIDGGAYPGIL